MAGRDVVRSAAPTWGETLGRLGLFTRAHVVTPIADTLRARRAEFSTRIAMGRQAARAAAAAAESATLQASLQLAMRKAHAGRLRSIYAAAALNRLNGDWIAGPLSADQTIRGDVRALRDRARQLMRDNPLAARFVRLCIENILGAEGIRLEMHVEDADGEPDVESNEIIESAWRRFCEEATVDGRSLNELARLVVAQWKGEGEALVHMTPYRNEFGFALQAIDLDQLDEQYTRTAGTGENEIRMGVELDQWNRPVSYWLWTAHPSDPTRHRVRLPVPAERIIHLFEQERPNQTRGVTRFAPVLTTLHMRDKLQEAVLILQRTAACKMGFLYVDPDKTTPLGADDATGEDGADGSPSASALANRVSWGAEPGAIEQLPEGMEFRNWDPGQPGPDYDPFTKNADRMSSIGLNVAYSSLTGDLSQATYGSQRGGLLSERDGWRTDHSTIIRQFYQRVFREWLKWALMRGALPLPFDLDRYAAAAHFQPRGFEWIDPEKDINASLAEVGAGLNSLTAIAAGKGRDFEQILRQRRKEQQLAAKYGVTLTLTPAKTTIAEDKKPGDTGAGETPTPSTEKDHANPGRARRLAAL